MTKPASTTKNPCKQHTPEFRHEALKQLAERIGVAAAARSGWYVWHQRRHQINRRQQLCLVCDNIVRVVFNTRTIERSPVCRSPFLHTMWLRFYSPRPAPTHLFFKSEILVITVIGFIPIQPG